MKKVLQFRDEWMKSKFRTATAHWALFYPGDYKRALKHHKERLADVRVRYGENRAKLPEGLLDSYPNVASFIREACYATLRSAHIIMQRQFTHQGNGYAITQQTKRHHKLIDLLYGENIPDFFIMNVAAQTGKLLSDVHLDADHHLKRLSWQETVEIAKNKAEFNDFAKYYNAMLRSWKWVNDALIGAKTLEEIWEKGAVIDCRGRSQQQVFAIAMAMRLPSEEVKLWLETCKQLTKQGFTDEQAACLSYFILWDERSFQLRGGHNHDFASPKQREQTDGFWKSVLDGSYTPKWTKKGWGKGAFYLFDCSHFEEGNVIPLTKVKGEGWNRKTIIDVGILKGLV